MHTDSSNCTLTNESTHITKQGYFLRVFTHTQKVMHTVVEVVCVRVCVVTVVRHC